MKHRELLRTQVLLEQAEADLCVQGRLVGSPNHPLCPAPFDWVFAFLPKTLRRICHRFIEARSTNVGHVYGFFGPSKREKIQDILNYVF
jgi:hypothetical protein